MARRTTRIAVGAALALTVSAPNGIPAHAEGCSLAGIDDRCESWVASYDHPGGKQGGSDDWMTAMEVSPDGDLVYVTGESWDDTTSSYDIATQALDASSGAQVWVARFDSGGFSDHPAALALTPDGETLIVAGTQRSGDTSPSDFVTIAYDADSGAELWVGDYDSGGAADDVAVDAVVAGGAVVVTGRSTAPESLTGIATVAYALEDGFFLWEARSQSGTAGRIATRIDASEDAVYVGGTSYEGEDADFLVLAYPLAGNGSTRTATWMAEYDAGSSLSDELADLAWAPQDDLVVVTGTATMPNLTRADRESDFETVAFDAGTGELRWRAGFSGPKPSVDYAADLEIGPRNGTVFVTGTALGDNRRPAFATVAYFGSSGERFWDNRSQFVWGQGAVSIAVAPDEEEVYVTGHSSTPVIGVGTNLAGVFGGKSDYTTLAFEALRGARLWEARADAPLPRTNFDLAYDIGVAPDGSRVFVSGVFGNRGESEGDPLNGWNVSNDYGTVAYDTSNTIR